MHANTLNKTRVATITITRRTDATMTYNFTVKFSRPISFIVDLAQTKTIRRKYVISDEFLAILY